MDDCDRQDIPDDDPRFPRKAIRFSPSDSNINQTSCEFARSMALTTNLLWEMTYTFLGNRHGNYSERPLSEDYFGRKYHQSGRKIALTFQLF